VCLRVVATSFEAHGSGTSSFATMGGLRGRVMSCGEADRAITQEVFRHMMKRSVTEITREYLDGAPRS
jgi:hypothetical protein